MDTLTGILLWSGLGALVAGFIGYKRREPLGGVVSGVLLGPVLGAALIWVGTLPRFATPER